MVTPYDDYINSKYTYEGDVMIWDDAKRQRFFAFLHQKNPNWYSNSDEFYQATIAEFGEGALIEEFYASDAIAQLIFDEEWERLIKIGALDEFEISFLMNATYEEKYEFVKDNRWKW